jgi:hypothetical protein
MKHSQSTNQETTVQDTKNITSPESNKNISQQVSRYAPISPVLLAITETICSPEDKELLIGYIKRQYNNKKSVSILYIEKNTSLSTTQLNTLLPAIERHIPLSEYDDIEIAEKQKTR